jgi:hypothetical protein
LTLILVILYKKKIKKLLQPSGFDPKGGHATVGFNPPTRGGGAQHRIRSPRGGGLFLRFDPPGLGRVSDSNLDILANSNFYSKRLNPTLPGLGPNRLLQF